MRNTIALVIALLFTTVDSTVLMAKPRKGKAARTETSKAKKAPTQQGKKAPTKKSKEKPKAGASKTKSTAKKSPKTAKEEAKKLKAEIKAWQKRKKDMQPLQLKDLVEENHRLKTQNRRLTTHVQELELSIKTNEEQLKTTEERTAQFNKLQNELDTLKKVALATDGAPRDLEDLPADSYTVDTATGQVFINGILDDRYGVDRETGKPFIKGIIFKVQISADKDLDLSDVLVDDSQHKNLEQEKAEGLNKYTIGHFRNYWEADKLKKGLRSMGVRWAWIVPYKDGKRVLLKEVLSTVIGKEK